MKRRSVRLFLFISLLAIGLSAAGAWAGNATVRWEANGEDDLNGYRLYHGTASREYGPYMPVASGTQATIDGLTPGETYYFAVTAVDTSGNESGFSAEVKKTIPEPADADAPRVAVTGPTDTGFFVTQAPAVTLSGTASDDGDVRRVEWTHASGGQGVANGTDNWRAADIPLQEGENEITVAAVDAAGNRGEARYVVTHSASRSLTEPVGISSLEVPSQREYRIMTGALKVGEPCYTDRSYTYPDVPTALTGSTYIRTPNDDMRRKDDPDYLQFRIDRDATVYVAYDDRNRPLPGWLNGFTDTGMDLKTYSPMSLFARDFPAGTVTLGANDGPGSMYTVVVAAVDGGDSPPAPDPAPEPAPEPTPDAGAVAVGGLEVDSNRTYRVREGGFQAGAVCYTDREYTYPTVPPALSGATFIQTANDDMQRVGGESFLAFTVDRDVVVYVALDDRNLPAPDWMAGFSDTGMDVKTYSAMSLFAKAFPAGVVTLGTNDGPGSMYTVVVAAPDGDAAPAPEPSDPPADDPPAEDPPVADPDDPAPAGAVAISGLDVASNRSYEVIDGGLEVGALCYTDRSYTYPEVPAALEGATYIRTANGDMYSRNDGDFMRFEVDRDVTVYVAHDDRNEPRPDWLSGFSDTGMDVKTYSAMSLFAKSFPAGAVTLGANDGPGSMYTVVVTPAGDDAPPPEPTDPAADDPVATDPAGEEPDGPAPTGPVAISGLDVASSRGYEVINGGLEVGALCYTDRSYTYPEVPAALEGATYIQTANGDMYSSGDGDFMRFEVDRDVTVYVAHDDRNDPRPDWMSGFSDTGMDLETWSAMSLFARDFPAGTVTLGANDGSGSMYTVVVVGR
jgi:chitodextrinase